MQTVSVRPFLCPGFPYPKVQLFQPKPIQQFMGQGRSKIYTPCSGTRIHPIQIMGPYGALLYENDEWIWFQMFLDIGVLVQIGNQR